MRYLKFSIIFILILIVATSCSENEEKPLEPHMTLTPVDLFEGDATKFKHFVGEMSGAYKLSYFGKKPNVNLHIDLWEDGKKTPYGMIGDVFFNSEEDQQRAEIEIIIAVESISIGDEYTDFDRIRVGVVDDHGSSLSTINRISDQKFSMKGTMSYAEPQTFSMEEPIHIWGIQATSENMLLTRDLSTQSLEELEWALVFTLNFE